MGIGSHDSITIIRETIEGSMGIFNVLIEISDEEWREICRKDARSELSNTT